MVMKQWLKKGFVWIGILLMLVGCSSNSNSPSSGGSTGQATGAAGGMLKFGLAAEPDTMDPYVQNGTSGRTMKLAIFRGLYNYNEKGELSPELAESYTNNEELTSYTFKLRSAKFHNGDLVTPEDVKFTFERMLAENSKATFKNELSVIESITVDSEDTVTFHLKEPSAPFVHYLALPESVIVSKTWTAENGGNIDIKPMGAGPFKFVSWNEGRDLTVEKFDGYYKEKEPKLDEIQFVFYADENTRVNALRAGDVDLVESVPWKDIASIEKDANLKLDSVNGPFMTLQFNTESGPLSDPKVRQAIAYAIDRQTIINTAFSGRGEAIYGMAIPEGYMGYDEKYTNYFKNDKEKAKQLLEEAGYPNGFKAKLLATSQYGYHEQTAVAVQSELKEVGIELELDLPDWASRVNKNLEGDYDILVAGTAGDITDADWMSNFYTGGGPRLNNSAYFDDKEINNLLVQGRQETDSTKREDIYNQLTERAMELSPFVYLMWREQSYGMRSNVTGFTNISGYLSFQSGITLENTSVK